MKRKYRHKSWFYYAVECDYCMKVIKRLPCVCVEIKMQRGDVGDFAYFHKSCYKKQLKNDVKL